MSQIVLIRPGSTEFDEQQRIQGTLDLPLSTVKSRLYTALKQLRMKLERTPVEIA